MSAGDMSAGPSCAAFSGLSESGDIFFVHEKGRAMEVFERVLSGQKRKATGEAMPQQQVDGARGGKRGKKKKARR